MKLSRALIRKRTNVVSRMLLFVLMIFTSSFSYALPGDIDLITRAALGETNIASDVIVQPDGKILAAGATSTNRVLDFSLARFNADGTPDLTFDADGIVSTSVSSSIDGALAVALQMDGKIVAAGYSGTPGTTSVAIVRYNADGSLDKTFDNDGIIVLAHSGRDEAATDVVIQSDGKIVIGGYTRPFGGFSNFFLARFNGNGSLDPSFGTNGTVSTVIGSGGDFSKALLLQPDGKFIAVGTSRTGENGDFAVVRYRGDGSLDPTFGTNGKVITPIGSGNDDGNAAALQSDGKIVVAGVTTEQLQSNLALVRYSSDGSVDTSFGSAGKVVAMLGGNSHAEDVTIQPSGKIIVVGGKYIGQDSDIAVVRYNSTGLLDPTFGVGGIVITNVDNRRASVTAVTLQGSEKVIVAGGLFNFSNDSPRGDLFVLRYLANSKTAFDFDGDGRADISVFRPSNGFWYVMKSTGGFSAVQWGLGTDYLVPGDYDGDGKTDMAVYRGIADNYNWYIRRSSDNTLFARSWGIDQGYGGAKPLPADYDGDGKTDLIVHIIDDFIGAIPYFKILQSSTNSRINRNFGNFSSTLVPSDYDGDGKADLVNISSFVNAPGVKSWVISQSSNGAVRVMQFGLPTDRDVPADYDGDGKTDIAVFRPSNGFWYRFNSSDGTFYAEQFGVATDKPVPADYDGDGRTDIAVFRPSNGTWYLQKSTEGFAARVFGFGDDIPVPNVYVR